MLLLLLQLLLLLLVVIVTERDVRAVLRLGVAALRAAYSIARVRYVASGAAQRVRHIPVGLAHVLGHRLEALVAEPQAATSLQTLLRRVARALRPVLLPVQKRVQQTHKLVIVDVIVQLLVLIHRVRARLALKLAHRARLLGLEAVRVRRKVALLLAVLHPLVLRLRVVAAALGIVGKLVDTHVAAWLALHSR